MQTIARQVILALAAGAGFVVSGCGLAMSQLQARLDRNFDGGCITDENPADDDLDVLVGFRSEAINGNIEIYRYNMDVFEPAPDVQSLTVPGVPVALEKCHELVTAGRIRLAQLVVANAAGEVYLIDVGTGAATLIGQANLLSVTGVEIVSRHFGGPNERKDVIIYGQGGGPFSSAEVFVDQGDGTYQPGGFPGGFGTIAFMEALNLDGDDDEDLVVGIDGNPANVRMLESDSAGTFTQVGSASLPGTVSGIASDDFTGDGLIDPLILTSDFVNGDKAHLLRNNGDLTLTSIDIEDVAGGPILATTGDLNGDGFTDAAIYGGSADAITLLMGEAGGTFGESRTHPSPDLLFAMAITDLNNDGDMDLGVVSRFERVAVSYFGDGDDIVSENITSVASSIENAAFVLDNFDNSPDGSLDAVMLSVPSQTGSQPYDLLMLPWDAPSDRFAAPASTQRLPFFTTAGLASADLDGVNGPDLVLTSSSDGAEVMLNDGTGAFVLQPRTITPGVLARIVELRTIDANATMDAVLLDNNGLSAWLGQGDGSFVAGPTMAVPARFMAVGRDADQTLHACTAHPALGDVSIFEVLPDGSFVLSDTVSIAPLDGVNGVVSGDWDGDGNDEFLLVVADDPLADTHVILLENQGAGQFAPTMLFTGTRGDGFGPLAIAMGDVQGDGLPDVVAVNDGNDFFVDEFAFVLQQEELQVTEPIELYLRGEPSGSVAVADLGNDGRTWIVTGKAGNFGEISALFMPGATEPGCPADLTGSSDPNDPSFGNPDGDADGDDFFFFLDAFTNSQLNICDLTGSSDPNDPSFANPDGDCDGDDFFFYLDLFVAGCP